MSCHDFQTPAFKRTRATRVGTIQKKLAKAKMGEMVGPFAVEIAHLSQDPTFTVRHRLNETNVSRLKSAFKSGGDITPITVAVVKERPGQWLIVDGHHRVTALEIIEAERELYSRRARAITVNANFVKLTAAQARWQAALANISHGQPITNKELRKAFRRYVEAGQHRTDDGTFKSYREMGRAFGKTHPTMRAWMVRFFPHLAKAMGDDGDGAANRGGDGAPPPVVPRKHLVTNALGDITAQFEATHYTGREDILRGLKLLLEDLERAHARMEEEFLEDVEETDIDPDADF